ncbi:MAG: SDR family oxidoreductase [Rhodospirillales bacterium]|jgi:NAD(P)-dependent dehydrogenase (short-subunit alcohol dehydrogenase family)|nr:SDR family oxidoreductase [Rhodospirillales bacterium]
MNVSGASAVVSGGGSGLGEATARALAAAGARVAVLDLDGDAAGRVAASIGGLGLACDVADATATEAAVAAARRAHGAARIAVMCAGTAAAGRIVGRDGPMPLDRFARVVAVNLIGTFNIMRLAAADMQTLAPLATGERGVVICTASIAAFDGQIGQASYAASKGGVVAMTLPAARELARFGIRVVTIAPGTFDTPMLAGMPDATRHALGQAVPFPPRLGMPEEFARLVLHILDNVMLNGEVIRLDGALRMPPS